MANKKTAGNVSVKHLQIDKSQSKMLGVMVAAVVIVVFGLVATKTLVSKGLYQRRALHATRAAAGQLKSNYDSANKLLAQYKNFAVQDPNILGGHITGTQNIDNQNSVITLDALPSKYDAPALASSIEKVLVGRTVAITSLKVTDDPTSNSDLAQVQPKSVPMAFSFEGTTSYAGASQLFKDFERSIRPFNLSTLEIDGTDQALRLIADMTTDYQPAKSLDLSLTKEVK